MFEIMIKREYTTDREVDTIPQIVLCLQTIEVNPQLQLNCIKNIFNGSIYRPVGGTKHIPVSCHQHPIHHQRIFVCAEIVDGEHKRPTWMILIQIINYMINEIIESFNCRASSINCSCQRIRPTLSPQITRNKFTFSPCSYTPF